MLKVQLNQIHPPSHHLAILPLPFLMRAEQMMLEYPIYCGLTCPQADFPVLAQVRGFEAPDDTILLTPATMTLLNISAGEYISVQVGKMPTAEHIQLFVNDMYFEWSEDLHEHVEAFLSEHGALHQNEIIRVNGVEIMVADLGTDFKAVALGNIDVKFDIQLPDRPRLGGSMSLPGIEEESEEEVFSDSSDEGKPKTRTFKAFSGTGYSLQ